MNTSGWPAPARPPKEVTTADSASAGPCRHHGALTVTCSVGPVTTATLGYAVVAAMSDPVVSQVVVDLASVDSIDSIDKTGLKILAVSQRTALRRRRTFQIASPSAAVINAALSGPPGRGRPLGQVKDALWSSRELRLRHGCRWHCPTLGCWGSGLADHAGQLRRVRLPELSGTEGGLGRSFSRTGPGHSANRRWTRQGQRHP